MTNGQEIHEGLFNILNHKGNENQNNIEISCHPSQNDYHQENKWVEGMAQVIEHLLSKHKDQSSNPIAVEKKKKVMLGTHDGLCLYSTYLERGDQEDHDSKLSWTKS
jgi:hypothetical protein